MVEKLKLHWSPDSISGSLQYTSLPYVSPLGIYKFVKSPYGRQLEPLLHSQAVKKKRGPKAAKAKAWLAGRVFIDERPGYIQERLEFGHWEGDFLESGQGKPGSLLVLQERKTRKFLLRKMLDRSTLNVNRQVQMLLAPLAPKSVTLDNDLSFQKHALLKTWLKTSIFFCHAYSSHEKGGIENLNR